MTLTEVTEQHTSYKRRNWESFGTVQDMGSAILFTYYNPEGFKCYSRLSVLDVTAHDWQPKE